jgi:putative Mg2+ transporter-C (MgtC) family protein
MAFDLVQTGHDMLMLAVAFLLALPVGWDREQEERTLGLRTFPIVAISSCGFILVGQSIAEGAPEAQARVLEGAITGIGFLGGGAIVKQGTLVKGTATAAALWATAAIGAAVAHERFEIAVTLSAVVLASLRWLRSLKRVVQSEADDRASKDEQDASRGPAA